MGIEFIDSTVPTKFSDCMFLYILLFKWEYLQYIEVDEIICIELMTDPHVVSSSIFTSPFFPFRDYNFVKIILFKWSESEIYYIIDYIPFIYLIEGQQCNIFYYFKILIFISIYIYISFNYYLSSIVSVETFIYVNYYLLFSKFK